MKKVYCAKIYHCTDCPNIDQRLHFHKMKERVHIIKCFEVSLADFLVETQTDDYSPLSLQSSTKDFTLPFIFSTNLILTELDHV